MWDDPMQMGNAFIESVSGSGTTSLHGSVAYSLVIVQYVWGWLGRNVKEQREVVPSMSEVFP